METTKDQSFTLLEEAMNKLEDCRYSEMPLAEKIEAFLENPEITQSELDAVYSKSLERWCGIKKKP